MLGKEGLTKQRLVAGVAGEAGVGGVPVLALVTHLASVDADVVAARLAVVGVHVLEAGAAVGLVFSHDVALSSQLSVALVTHEVLHVPTPTLRLRALVRENYLNNREDNVSRNMDCVDEISIITQLQRNALKHRGVRKNLRK